MREQRRVTCSPHFHQQKLELTAINYGLVPNYHKHAFKHGSCRGASEPFHVLSAMNDDFVGFALPQLEHPSSITATATTIDPSFHPDPTAYTPTSKQATKTIPSGVQSIYALAVDTEHPEESPKSFPKKGILQSGNLILIASHTSWRRHLGETNEKGNLG